MIDWVLNTALYTFTHSQSHRNYIHVEYILCKVAVSEPFLNYTCSYSLCMIHSHWHFKGQNIWVKYLTCFLVVLKKVLRKTKTVVMISHQFNSHYYNFPQSPGKSFHESMMWFILNKAARISWSRTLQKNKHYPRISLDCYFWF